MHRDPKKLDQLRDGRSEIENHVIDEFILGHINRREFLRRGSIMGISIPLLGAIVTACGGANSSSGAKVCRAGGHHQLDRHQPATQVDHLVQPSTC